MAAFVQNPALTPVSQELRKIMSIQDGQLWFSEKKALTCKVCLCFARISVLYGGRVGFVCSSYGDTRSICYVGAVMAGELLDDMGGYL